MWKHHTYLFFTLPLLAVLLLQTSCRDEDDPFAGLTAADFLLTAVYVNEGKEFEFTYEDNRLEYVTMYGSGDEAYGRYKVQYDSTGKVERLRVAGSFPTSFYTNNEYLFHYNTYGEIELVTQNIPVTTGFYFGRKIEFTYDDDQNLIEIRESLFNGFYPDFNFLRTLRVWEMNVDGNITSFSHQVFNDDEEMIFDSCRSNYSYESFDSPYDHIAIQILTREYSNNNWFELDMMSNCDASDLDFLSRKLEYDLVGQLSNATISSSNRRFEYELKQ